MELLGGLLPEKKQKLVLFGASGLLGINWLARPSSLFHITPIYNRNPISFEGARSFDLSKSPEDIKNFLHSASPDIIVNATGLTNVEHCERCPAQAEELNVFNAKFLCEMALELGTYLVHISTDHFFNNKSDFARATETSPVSPVNHYGRTKLIADEFISRKNPHAMIVRTNFFGIGHSHRKSFSDWIISSLRSQKEIHMYKDVRFSSIYVQRLIDLLEQLIIKKIRGPLNIVSDDKVSKLEFARLLAEVFDLPQALIFPSLYSENSAGIPRPSDMALDNRLLTNILPFAADTLKNDFIRLRADEERKLAKTIDHIFGKR